MQNIIYNYNFFEVVAGKQHPVYLVRIPQNGFERPILQEKMPSSAFSECALVLFVCLLVLASLATPKLNSTGTLTHSGGCHMPWTVLCGWNE